MIVDSHFFVWFVYTFTTSLHFFEKTRKLCISLYWKDGTVFSELERPGANTINDTISAHPCSSPELRFLPKPIEATSLLENKHGRIFTFCFDSTEIVYSSFISLPCTAMQKPSHGGAFNVTNYLQYQIYHIDADKLRL